MYGSIEWLNENELRAYPLLEGEYSDMLSENVILDLQLVIQENSSNEIPRLLSYRSDTTGAEFTFTGDNIFSISYPDGADSIRYPYYIRNNMGSLLVLGEGLKAINTEGLREVAIPVEPATVYYFSGAWLGVKTIRPYRGYLTSIGTYEPILPLIQDTDDLKLTGDVELTEGYNYRIDFRNGKINLAAAFGIGFPMTCDTQFIRAELKDCSSLVSYINGVPPDKDGVFRFTPGTNIYLFNGLSVTEDIPDDTVEPTLARVNENTLFVGLTFLETDLCSPVQLLPTNN